MILSEGSGEMMGFVSGNVAGVLKNILELGA